MLRSTNPARQADRARAVAERRTAEKAARRAALIATPGRMATNGPGLQAMRDLAEYHDLQRCAVDRSTYERAIVKTASRIRSGHPANKVVA